MNGNIFNYSLASVPYSWKGCGYFGCSTYSAYAIPPAPPGNISTITGEPIFIQSYINAYNTGFNQPRNRQRALYNYQYFNPDDIDVSFIPGTFGYKEIYNNALSQSFYINYLQDDAIVYSRTSYLFVSAGSGGGSGFIYLNWIIVTYGVPYIVNVS